MAIVPSSSDQFTDCDNTRGSSLKFTSASCLDWNDSILASMLIILWTNLCGDRKRSWAAHLWLIKARGELLSLWQISLCPGINSEDEAYWYLFRWWIAVPLQPKMWPLIDDDDDWTVAHQDEQHLQVSITVCRYLSFYGFRLIISWRVNELLQLCKDFIRQPSFLYILGPLCWFNNKYSATNTSCWGSINKNLSAERFPQSIQQLHPPTQSNPNKSFAAALCRRLRAPLIFSPWPCLYANMSSV